MSIPLDGENRSKGFAFCDYATKELAEAAIRNLNGTELKSKLIRESSEGELHNRGTQEAEASDHGYDDRWL